MDELIPIIEKIVNVGIGALIVYGILFLIVFGVALTIILYIFKQIVGERKKSQKDLYNRRY